MEAEKREAEWKAQLSSRLATVGRMASGIARAGTQWCSTWVENMVFSRGGDVT